METIAFLGCSRGLGKEVCIESDRQSLAPQFLLVARNEKHLTSLSQQLKTNNKILNLDFSNKENLPQLLRAIKENNVKRVFYFAGGGPYGLFHAKEWKDHLWSLQVSFLMPAELLHSILRDPDFSFVEQIIFVGSLVADHKADPKAASYASAKHGLKGLVESIITEGCAKDLRFFRPGYMNTDLLPANATPRLNETALLEPQQVAKDFIQWAFDPLAAKVIEAPRL